MRRIEASITGRAMEATLAPLVPKAHALILGDDEGADQLMRILVTGGAGFIGSHYVRTMLAGGYPGFEQAEVTALDKLTYAGNLANLDPVENGSGVVEKHGATGKNPYYLMSECSYLAAGVS